ncbi:hypothetical protein [Arthrobacter sp. JCM 19049]|uniref:hypothetical protein n=1 Tax=Arthrobacter sp. JCM 19049 TaxID=1460643 RepID=UPI0024364119|nr:hypothetical protein [Arthrobacter sp. JCM 19049]
MRIRGTLALLALTGLGLTGAPPPISPPIRRLRRMKATPRSPSPRRPPCNAPSMRSPRTSRKNTRRSR